MARDFLQILQILALLPSWAGAGVFGPGRPGICWPVCGTSGAPAGAPWRRRRDQSGVGRRLVGPAKRRGLEAGASILDANNLDAAGFGLVAWLERGRVAPGSGVRRGRLPRRELGGSGEYSVESGEEAG